MAAKIRDPQQLFAGAGAPVALREGELQRAADHQRDERILRHLGGLDLESLLLQGGEELLHVLCLVGKFLGPLLFGLQPV